MQDLMEYRGELAFAIERLDAESAVGRMSVGTGMLNPFGTVHAGALVWFADVVATTLALGKLDIRPGESGFPLAINLNANLFANQSAGDLRAHASFVRRGRRVTVVRTRITGSDGRLLAELTSTHVPAA